MDTAGRYGDGRGGHGLSMLVKHLKDGSVSKTFSQRLTVDGRARNIGLGAYPLVSLQEARDMAKENARKVRRHRVRRGVDALLAGNVAPVAPPHLSRLSGPFCSETRRKRLSRSTGRHGSRAASRNNNGASVLKPTPSRASVTSWFRT